MCERLRFLEKPVIHLVSDGPKYKQIDRKNTRLEGFIDSTEITRSSVIIASTHLRLVCASVLERFSGSSVKIIKERIWVKTQDAARQ